MAGAWMSWGIQGGPAAGYRGNPHRRNGGLLRQEQQGIGHLLWLSMARRSQQLFTGSWGWSGVFSEHRVQMPSYTEASFRWRCKLTGAYQAALPPAQGVVPNRRGLRVWIPLWWSVREDGGQARSEKRDQILSNSGGFRGG